MFQTKPFLVNTRPGIIALLIPLFTIILLACLVITLSAVSNRPNNTAEASPELITKASQAILEKMPENDRQFAYYEVLSWQTPEYIASHFGVPLAKLTALNPGVIAPGATIKIPPVESALEEKPTTAITSESFEIKPYDTGIAIHRDFKDGVIITTLPQLADLLRDTGILTEVEPMVWRINRPLLIDNAIQLQLTDKTIKRLEIASQPNNVACLCLDDAEMLIKDISIATVDGNGQPDTNTADGRGFIRALGSSRMDIIQSDIGYLGNEFMPQAGELQKKGATYGVSWRIEDGTHGKVVTTGWVEGSTFHNNYFGSYMFGASGMVWKNNTFKSNDRYGLDPHDDSNNALIEGNRFESNGKQGLILARRCNNNIVRNNTSVNNRLHGIMLHEDSNFNVIENNTLEGNRDNIVIYDSHYNRVSNNTLSNALDSNIRIAHNASLNVIADNVLSGKGKGLLLFDNVSYILAHENTITTEDVPFSGHDAIDHIVFTANQVNRGDYSIEGTAAFIGGNSRI